MSATVHISAQVIIYKKHDINLGTYPNHTKTQIDKPFNAKTTYNNTLKPQKHITKKIEKTKKATVQQTNIK
jgi:hypothetical protein